MQPYRCLITLNKYYMSKTLWAYANSADLPRSFLGFYNYSELLGKFASDFESRNLL